MDGLTELEGAFHRLLVDRAARDRLRSGDLSAFGDETRRALAGVDPDELDRLADAIRRGLGRGELGGVGILAAYPETLAALGTDPEVVVERFLAEAPLDGLDGIGRRAGISIVEAFHDWAAGEIGSVSARCRLQHEWIAAAYKALTTNPSPGFCIRSPLIRRTARGWMSVLDADRPLSGADDRPDRPVVYTSGLGRFATGAVSHRIAAILYADDPEPPAWARASLATVDRAVRDAVQQQLADRGLR